MGDEGFHEIQLNGKQLVFLFMAAAVVAVVVFLSGVMVGRGVRAEKAALQPAEAPAAADLAATGAGATAPQSTAVAAGLPSADAGIAKPVAPPPPVADDIARANPPEGRGAPAAGAAAAATPPATRDESRKAAPSAAPASQPAATAPRGAETGTYAVQVAAPTDRAAAEAIAKRLVGKGYSAYVLDPGASRAAAVYYRVRVGPFKTRREADEARRRLEKEEQFKPFITR